MIRATIEERVRNCSKCFDLLNCRTSYGAPRRNIFALCLEVLVVGMFTGQRLRWLHTREGAQNYGSQGGHSD
ncbi:hypothetical protein LCGC14_0264420 [marine sediment metagenome]|uniref:Uncharacterized protein n=1 Tax=marine sediment metagenome TaxID=412755 RepID=A0A0F9U0Y2_9ZZZZ